MCGFVLQVRMMMAGYGVSKMFEELRLAVCFLPLVRVYMDCYHMFDVCNGCSWRLECGSSTSVMGVFEKANILNKLNRMCAQCTVPRIFKINDIQFYALICIKCNGQFLFLNYLSVSIKSKQKITCKI